MVSTGRHSNRASKTRVRRVALLARDAARLAFEVQRQLLAEKEVLGGHARVGAQAERNEVQDTDHQIEDGADHHG